MKPSETIAIMYRRMKTVPAARINQEIYLLADYARCHDLYAGHVCNSQGCVIGWATTTPELKPVEEDFLDPVFGYPRDYIYWPRYVARILGLPATTHWRDIPLYSWMFGKRSYGRHVTKKEILRRLKYAERALREADEDPYRVQDTSVVY